MKKFINTWDKSYLKKKLLNRYSRQDAKEDLETQMPGDCWFHGSLQLEPDSVVLNNDKWFSCRKPVVEL